MLRALSLGVLAFLALTTVTLMTETADAQRFTNDPEDILVLELADGEVRIQLFPDLAPLHVNRIRTLTRQGFYDGLTWHRVIDGFMAQTGDPRGDGTGGSSLPNLPAEFSGLEFSRGIVGAARSNNPDSANSQFFIVFEEAPWLNGQYTAFGVVIRGMEFVDQIKRGDEARGGAVEDPDTIISMKVLADISG